MINPFLSAGSAALYAAGRPDVQPALLERVRPFLSSAALGVDVACGTGQCSVALAELVGEVRAFDSSAAMLTHARPHQRVRYALAPAEALPLPDGCADVMTAFMAFHWFERDAFLAEARRVLKPGGVLAVCNSWFTGEMKWRPAFHLWAEKYYRRFPSPPRERRSFGPNEARAGGFSFQAERWTHPVKLKRNALVAYLLSQSNALKALDEGTQTEGQLAAQLHAELAHLLPEGEVGEFVFGAEVWVLGQL